MDWCKLVEIKLCRWLRAVYFMSNTCQIPHCALVLSLLCCTISANLSKLRWEFVVSFLFSQLNRTALELLKVLGIYLLWKLSSATSTSLGSSSFSSHSVLACLLWDVLFSIQKLFWLQFVDQSRAGKIVVVHRLLCVKRSVLNSLFDLKVGQTLTSLLHGKYTHVAYILCSMRGVTKLDPRIQWVICAQCVSK